MIRENDPGNGPESGDGGSGIQTRWRTPGLQGKFLLFLIPPVILATLLALAALGIHTQREFEEQLRQSQEERLAAYGAALVTPLWEFNQEGIRRILESIALDPDLAAIALYDERGGLLARVPGTHPPDDPPWLQLRHPIIHQGQGGSYPLGELELTLHPRRLARAVQQQLLLGTLILSLLVGAAVISAILAHRQIIQRPLNRLMGAIHALERGEAPPIPPARAPDELGQVLQAFDHMATRLARDQALLLKSENRFRTAFENAAHGMALISLEGRFLQVNQALCQILGHTGEELLSPTPLAFVDPFRDHRATLARLLSGERETWELERPLTRPDGNRIHTTNTLAVVRDAAGRPLHCIAHIRDVTAQRRDQAYRLRNEERLNLLLALHPLASELSEPELCTRILEIAVTVTDSRIGYLHMVNEDQETIRLVTWNAAALELCTATHATHYPLSEAGIWADSFRRKRPVVHNDFPHEPNRKGYPEGHFPVARHMSAPVLEGEKVRMIVGVGNKETPYEPGDVEQLQLVAVEALRFLKRWWAEESLRTARRQAEAASQAKSEFLAIMSHEIRTPLNVLLGMSDVLQESLLSEEQKGHLAVVQQAGDHLLTLINDILDLSKIEAGGVELEAHPFQPETLFQAAGEMMRQRALAKGLEFQLLLPSRLPPWVRGDETRLRQIVMNLLGNAVKFTEAGKITLEVEYIPQGSLFRLTISDTGVGIAPRHLAQIFDKFAQADASISRRYGGSGLGLAIARSLVELMGGTITVESTLGQGSTFRITLSLATTTDPHRRAPPEGTLPPLEALPPLTILLAEDSQDNQNLIRTYLKKTPWQLETAMDGREAVERVLAGGIDLVLMDIQMPLMDGYAATREIRRWEREHHRPPLPILALSAHALESERHQSLEAGCDRHLIKPIKKAPLLQAIHQAATTRGAGGASTPEPHTPPERALEAPGPV